jgi:hypothetical protein
VAQASHPQQRNTSTFAGLKPCWPTVSLYQRASSPSLNRHGRISPSSHSVPVLRACFCSQAWESLRNWVCGSHQHCRLSCLARSICLILKTRKPSSTYSVRSVAMVCCPIRCMCQIWSSGWRLWPEAGAIPEWRLEELQAQLNIGYWNSKFGLYGAKEVAQAHFNELKKVVAKKAPKRRQKGA